MTDGGELKLVDYDCMCVPLLVGRKNLEVGMEPYQHPNRNADTLLTPGFDNFSAWFIFVALKALAASPGLWATYVENKYDKLLFRSEDLLTPAESSLVQDLKRSPNQEVQRLARQFLELSHIPIDQVPSLDAALFSWNAVSTLLDHRDFDGAVEMVTRNRKADAEAPPPLPSRLREARQRIHCRAGLEKAVAAGDEPAMQRLYLPKLLDDYPKARPGSRCPVRFPGHSPSRSIGFRRAAAKLAGVDSDSGTPTKPCSPAARRPALFLPGRCLAGKDRGRRRGVGTVEAAGGSCHRLAAAWSRLQQVGGSTESSLIGRRLKN